jgi:hypothetical protein
MGNPALDPLGCLQEWYSAHCDGDWEHHQGVSIGTLDNPGWYFKVDLTNTELSNRAFDEIKIEGTEKNNWYSCRVKDCTFEGFCGPHQLGEVITLFLKWANGTARGDG